MCLLKNVKLCYYGYYSSETKKVCDLFLGLLELDNDRIDLL